jgi:5'-deoxynucleotidase YfbR-like HD superfamily hydrolase
MIGCQSGRIIDPWNVTEDDLCIEDTAHSLALINRFGGHTREPINVAWHSYCVAQLVRYKYPNGFHAWSGRKLYRQALMHDAAESLLGDLNRWVKKHESMEAYRKLEAEVQRCFANKFDFPHGMMVRFEMEMGYGLNNWPTKNPDFGPVTPEENKIICDAGAGAKCPGWRTSEEIFLTAFAACSPAQPV